MSDKTVKALCPKGLFNDIIQAPLSPRLDTFSGKTVYIVESWPVHTGFDEIIAMFTDYISAKYENVTFVNRKRIAYSSDDPKLWKEMREKADAFVYFGAPSCSTTAYAVTWPARALERAGIPGLTVIYKYLQADAEMSKDREGMEIRCAILPYPCENIPKSEKDRAVRDIEAALMDPLTENELRAGVRTPEQPPRFCAEGTEEELQEYFQTNGLTDGLPVIIPTEERVEAMLKGTSHKRDEVVCTLMAPEGRKVTVEGVAINAVMAGCLPSYMPILLAAAEITGRNQSFHATSKSTNSFSFMQVVNGPIRKETGMNDSVCALGPGGRANATIGRFLRLALTNLGGAEVGVNLMGVQGNVGCYSFAFAENEEASPWGETYATGRGYKKDESVLTILTGGWGHCGNYMFKKGIGQMTAAMKEFESIHGFAVLLSPHRAQLLKSESGCGSLKEAEDFIWNDVSMTIGELKKRGLFERHIVRDFKAGKHEWPAEYQTLPDDAVVPIYPRSQVNVIVVGDPQGSDVMQGWSMNNASSASIDNWR